jgi:hypothetical protein
VSDLNPLCGHANHFGRPSSTRAAVSAAHGFAAHSSQGRRRCDRHDSSTDRLGALGFEALGFERSVRSLWLETVLLMRLSQR